MPPQNDQHHFDSDALFAFAGISELLKMRTKYTKVNNNLIKCLLSIRSRMKSKEKKLKTNIFRLKYNETKD